MKTCGHPQHGNTHLIKNSLIMDDSCFLAPTHVETYTWPTQLADIMVKYQGRIAQSLSLGIKRSDPGVTFVVLSQSH